MYFFIYIVLGSIVTYFYNKWFERNLEGNKYVMTTGEVFLMNKLSLTAFVLPFIDTIFISKGMKAHLTNNELEAVSIHEKYHLEKSHAERILFLKLFQYGLVIEFMVHLEFIFASLIFASFMLLEYFLRRKFEFNADRETVRIGMGLHMSGAILKKASPKWWSFTPKRQTRLKKIAYELKRLEKKRN